MRIASRIKILLLLAISTAGAFSNIKANATTPDESEKNSSVKMMIAIASQKEEGGKVNDYWEAASLYCKASRQGSIEAQYRLAMLYAYGKGVPKNRAYAATLFSIASQQGHNEAFNMLEIINFTSETLPPCLEGNSDPERLSWINIASSSQTSGIDRYIAQFPNEKRWALDLAITTAEWYSIDPKLVISIIANESGFNEHAKSNANAMGMMQLIPATAKRFNVKNAFNAAQNIKGGVRYLRWLINYYLGDIELAVAAYNAGEKAVDRYKGIPPYKETREYVRKFKSLYPAKFHPYTNIKEISPLKK